MWTGPPPGAPGLASAAWAGSPSSPPGSAYEPGADEIVLRLDPEMAFGSGEHGSTRAALALLERAVRPGDFVMDLGSGSGILSIAAVKLGAVQAVGIEVDGDTIPIAIENAGPERGRRPGGAARGRRRARWPRCSPRAQVSSPTFCGW